MQQSAHTRAHTHTPWATALRQNKVELGIILQEFKKEHSIADREGRKNTHTVCLGPGEMIVQLTAPEEQTSQCHIREVHNKRSHGCFGVGRNWGDNVASLL